MGRWSGNRKILSVFHAFIGIGALVPLHGHMDQGKQLLHGGGLSAEHMAVEIVGKAVLLLLLLIQKIGDGHGIHPRPAGLGHRG